MLHPLLRLGAFAIALFFASAAWAQDTWTAVAAPTHADLWGICYGGNQFVAVGSGGTILTSPDGLTWTARSSGTAEWITAVGYSGAFFVAVGDHGTILTSPDGVAWVAQNSGTTARLNGIGFGATRLLAVGENGTVCTSLDGVLWSATNAGVNTFLRGVAWRQDTGFVITGGQHTVLTTTDGVHFERRGLNTDANLEAVINDGSGFTTVGQYGLWARATDPHQWVEDGWRDRDRPYFRGLTLFNGYLVAVGEKTSTYYAPIVTVPWRSMQFGAGTADARYCAVAASNEVAVAVGFAGAIARSVAPAIAPNITRVEAESVEPYIGGRIRLSVICEPSAGPLRYQWQRDGTVIVGATTSTLTIDRADEADSGRYTVVVENSIGSDTWATEITVHPAPAWTSFIDPVFAPPIPVAADAVAVQPDGRIVVAAPMYFYPAGEPQYGIARLNADGSIDDSFRLSTSVGQFSSSPTHLTLRPNGEIVVSGGFGSADGGYYLWGLIRADGVFVPQTGRFVPQLELSDGRSIRVITTNDAAGSRVSITRYLADGAVDGSYPVAELDVTDRTHPHGMRPEYEDVVAAPDEMGRILVAVVSHMYIGTSAWGVNTSRLFRLLADGTLDSTFALQTVDDDIGQVVCANGKIFYQAIWREGSLGSQWRLKISRLNGDGTSDSDYTPLRFGGGIAPSVATYLEADGSALVATQTGICRYLPDGKPDPKFSAPVPEATAIAVLPDGRLLLTGNFTEADGRPSPGLVRVAPLTNAITGRLVNLSIRTNAGNGDDTLIAGFVIAGRSGTRSLLARAVGPGLIPLGLNANAVAADPRLTLFHGQAVAGTNDDWDYTLSTKAAAVGAQPLVRGSKDAALFTTLAPGLYTAHVNSSHDSGGIALIELYDCDAPPESTSAARLVNLSGRAHVGTWDNVLIAGFVIAGETSKRLLIRGIGPALRAQGIADALADPVLELHRGHDIVARNDNWDAADASAFSAAGAFALEAGSKDAALVVDLTPGVYSAVVRGVANTTGTAMVELFEVP